MESVFKLPFSLRTSQYDWLVVLVILMNIITLTAYLWAYIEFKVRPPLEKYHCLHLKDYINEFTEVRKGIIYFTRFMNALLAVSYILYVIARILHLLLFE